MIFIPGMKPGHVSGAAGSSRARRGSKLTFGNSYRGQATPSNIVPYEEAKGPSQSAERKEREARAKDVAAAFDFNRDSPNSAREKLAAVRAEAESVQIDV